MIDGSDNLQNQNYWVSKSKPWINNFKLKSCHDQHDKRKDPSLWCILYSYTSPSQCQGSDAFFLCLKWGNKYRRLCLWDPLIAHTWWFLLARSLQWWQHWLSAYKINFDNIEGILFIISWNIHWNLMWKRVRIYRWSFRVYWLLMMFF